MTNRSTHIVRFCLAALLAGLLALVAAIWGLRRQSTVQHYQDAFGKVDRVVVKGIRADRETGQIIPIEATVTNSSAIANLSNTFFTGRGASSQAKFSFSPPIAGTRLHITVTGFSGCKAVCGFEVVGSRRIFLNKHLWLDIPEADLPEAVHRACKANSSPATRNSQ